MKRFSLFLSKFMVVSSFPLLAFCSHIERRWTHQSKDPSLNVPYEKQDHDRDLIKEELGWKNQNELDPDQENQLEKRQRLKALERELLTDGEKAQYYGLKGQMKDDQERMEFLSIEDLDAREQWARNRGYLSHEEGFTDELADLIEKKDLALKMPKKAVLESWGDPELIEMAGNPIYGFERWRYTRYESSDEGFKKIERLVYFESGVVVGWETLHH